MSEVRLAHCGPPDALNKALSVTSTNPALLVSYIYLAPFLKARANYKYRSWVLDSGAFSAHAAGKTIELSKYIEVVKGLLAGDDPPAEVFALDVIGDHVASAKNADLMVEAGLDVIPCFHYGEPWELLIEMASRFDKIALGGVARMREKQRIAWVGQCFARVWPKKIHGFGMSTRGLVLGFPFHSVDATSWELGPCGFGNWKAFGKMSVRGSTQNLRAEVEWYMKLEREAQRKWKKEMAELGCVAPASPSVALGMNNDIRPASALAPTVHLAVGGDRSGKERTLGAAPSVALGPSGVHTPDKQFALGNDNARKGKGTTK